MYRGRVTTYAQKGRDLRRYMLFQQYVKDRLAFAKRDTDAKRCQLQEQLNDISVRIQNTKEELATWPTLGVTDE